MGKSHVNMSLWVACPLVALIDLQAKLPLMPQSVGQIAILLVVATAATQSKGILSAVRDLLIGLGISVGLIAYVLTELFSYHFAEAVIRAGASVGSLLLSIFGFTLVGLGWRRLVRKR